MCSYAVVVHPLAGLPLPSKLDYGRQNNKIKNPIFRPEQARRAPMCMLAPERKLLGCHAGLVGLRHNRCRATYGLRADFLRFLSKKRAYIRHHSSTIHRTKSSRVGDGKIGGVAGCRDIQNTTAKAKQPLSFPSRVQSGKLLNKLTNLSLASRRVRVGSPLVKFSANDVM